MRQRLRSFGAAADRRVHAVEPVEMAGALDQRVDDARLRAVFRVGRDRERAAGDADGRGGALPRQREQRAGGEEGGGGDGGGAGRHGAGQGVVRGGGAGLGETAGTACGGRRDASACGRRRVFMARRRAGMRVICAMESFRGGR